jgi:glycosyltransferase involved in cell wall biosynthesis
MSMPRPFEQDAMEAEQVRTALTVVIVCDHAYVSGGLAQVAVTCACLLRAAGHRVIYFAGVGPVCSTLTAAGVETICLDQAEMIHDPSAARAALRGLWNREARSRLASCLSMLEPENSLVHLHGWSKALSPSVIATAHSSGLAVLHTLHDYFLVCPNGGLYDYVDRRNCDLTPMSCSCAVKNCDARRYSHKLWRLARNALLPWGGDALGNAHMIYLSEDQRRLLGPILPPSVRLHYVPNPVDAEDLGPAPVAQNTTNLFIGRLSTEKAPMLLARAAEEENLPCSFIGDGPQRAALAARTGIPLVGWQDKPAVVASLRAARTLVFPSVWHETFGLTVCEALANGVPVIVSAGTAAAELVVDGETGLLFRNGDLYDLRRCLRAMADPDFAARLGDAAYRRYWSAPLTPQRHLTALMKTYRAVLDDGRNAAKGFSL